MATINYVKGDATYPEERGLKIIVHICNDVGAWGKGFVMALSKRWETPERLYREWFRSKENFTLGQVQLVNVELDIWVANLIGQRDIRKAPDGTPPIRYEAVRQGLEYVCMYAKECNATVHMPKIGCGLAGGTWQEMEPIIEKELCAKGISVTVYDL